LEAKADEPKAEEAPAAEQPAEEEKEQPKVEEKAPADTTTNKQSSVMKLLKQRNEAKAKVEELEAKLKNSEALETRIKELEEGIAAQELEKEAQKERDDFYSKFPNAK
jgi:spore germination protein GerM